MGNIHIVMQGNVGDEPITKMVGERFLLGIRVAVTPQSKKDGQWTDDETVWFNVSMFGRKAENVADVIQKGDSVLISGNLRTRSYEGKDGTKQHSHDVLADNIAIEPKPARRKTQEEPAW